MISVITFYTPEYNGEISPWRNSCMKHLFAETGISNSDNRYLVLKYPFKSYEMPSKGSWTHNCTMKADVVLNAQKELGDGVVWTDVDARFKSYPALFENLDQYDFGCYWIPNVWNQKNNVRLRPWGADRGDEALAGGTMFFNNTPICIEMIEAWKEECARNPDVWEQQSLQKVWDRFDKKGLRTFNFPQSYCKVFDAPWFEPKSEVVVEHTQASRRLKSKVGR